MSDYENFMDMPSDWAPLSSPSTILDPNDDGLNPISETFPQTNLLTDPQSEKRSSGLRKIVAAKVGFDIPPLEIESINSFANSFNNLVLVSSPILVISPGFRLSPLLESPNMFSSSSSHIIPPCPIPNDAPLEMVESSGGARAAMMVINNNPPHQPMDVDLPSQGGSNDIPTEESVYITSHEFSVDPIGAPLVLSFHPEVVAETDVMNLISLESGSEDDDKKREYNQEEDKDEDHNIVIEPSSRKRRKTVISNMGVTRQNKTQKVIIQVESEEDHPDDGFHWRKYGQKVVRGNANPRGYYKCTYIGYKVTKHVERSTNNVKLVVATYNGIHEHGPPVEQICEYGTKNQSGSSVSQNPSNQTLGLGMPPSSFLASQVFSSSLDPQTDKDRSNRTPQLGQTPYSSSASQLFLSPLAPQLDMMKYYMDGISKMPNLPVNQNHGFMNRDDETKIDRLISKGTKLYKAIRERLALCFGIN